MKKALVPGVIILLSIAAILVMIFTDDSRKHQEETNSEKNEHAEEQIVPNDDSLQVEEAAPNDDEQQREGDSLTVDYLKDVSRFEVELEDEHGEAYTVYLFAENEDSYIEENGWAAADVGDTIYEGLYSVALVKQGEVMEDIALKGEYMFTDNKDWVYVIEIEDGPDILVVEQFGNSSNDLAQFFAIQHDILQQIEIGGNKEIMIAGDLEYIGNRQFQTKEFYNGSTPPWGIFTWKFDVQENTMTLVEERFVADPNDTVDSHDFTVDSKEELKQIIETAMATGKLGPFDQSVGEMSLDEVQAVYGEPTDMYYASCTECDDTDVAYYGDYGIEFWYAKSDVFLLTNLDREQMYELIGEPTSLDIGMYEYELYENGNYTIAILYQDWSTGYGLVYLR